jgi:hypothetical protein
MTSSWTPKIPSGLYQASGDLSRALRTLLTCQVLGTIIGLSDVVICFDREWAGDARILRVGIVWGLGTCFLYLCLVLLVYGHAHHCSPRLSWIVTYLPR